MTRLVRKLLLGAGGLLAVSGCTVGPNFRPPSPPTVDRYTPTALPAQAPAGGGQDAQRFALGAAVADRWWTLFGSTRLDALEDEALKANPDLQSAQAALSQAHELYLAQRASRYPTVDLGLNATGAKNSDTLSSPLNSNAQLYSLYTAQLNVSYVLDVFGGVRRQTESVAAQAENQKYLTEGVYLTLTANVANAALQLAGFNSQMDDVQRLIQADARALAITRQQRQLGEASTADEASAEATLETAEQLAPPLKKQIDQERDLLAALIGRAPSEAPADRFEVADFQLPPDLPVSLPSDLVRQRPDVRAAEANIHVAAALVGVAAAARLPSFTLAATPGGESTTVGTLFSNGNAFWSISAAASQTVFDAGALRHKQRAAEAALAQAQAQYRSAVIAALQNTADVLQAIVDDGEAMSHAATAEAIAARSLRLTSDQFAQGQVGRLAVLSAEATERQAMVTLTQAKSARYVDTVALYQALGGGWNGRS